MVLNVGCGACHVVPGIREARGRYAAPLDAIAQRTYIAGVLPNSRRNLARWIADPQRFKPNTAMPPLGLTAAEADNVASFLLDAR